MSKARLEAFSDGVFAVAITLLVIEIAVPGEHGDLAHQVGQLWPSFAGYLVSFATIGIIWVNHHTMVTRFERLDRTVLFLNLNLLLWVVLIPWSTALIAEHLRDTGSDEHFAAASTRPISSSWGSASRHLALRHAHRDPARPMTRPPVSSSCATASATWPTWWPSGWPG